jgi:hypothetical protein
MNPKIKKVIGDIEKTKERITEHQNRLRELERLKIELENADIVAMVRSIDVLPAELETFIRAFIEQRKAKPVKGAVGAVQDGYDGENIVDDGYSTNGYSNDSGAVVDNNDDDYKEDGDYDE